MRDSITEGKNTKEDVTPKVFTVMLKKKKNAGKSV